jgi:transposase
VGDARQHGGACPRLRRRGKIIAGEPALGRSRGGFSSKLHGLADGLGNPLAFRLTAGQQGDAPQALPLLDRLAAKAVLADKAYDTDAILQAVAAGRALAVIPPRASRVHQRPTDWQLYQQRHKIEILFGFMKHYRRVFARFEKLARRYLAFVHLVAACILLR